jgi:hypothetical protein
MNGIVKSEISEVTVEKTDWSRYSARIGNGGSEIEIKGINGNVRLSRSDKPSTVAASDDKSNSTKAAKGPGKVD